MGRTIFISLITLMVGFCLGLLFTFGFLEPEGPDRPRSSLLPQVMTSAEIGTANAAPTATAAPKLDTADNAPLLETAGLAVTALKEQNYRALANLVHPEDGVLFAPYSTVDPNANLRFTADQIAALPRDNETYVWGLSDGMGTPIELTMADYFARFVYNADYANAPVIGVDRVVGTGNALENVADAFPGARFVEYYFPGIKAEHNGFDWCGLKLVFSVFEEQYKLIAVIHSEWTI